MFPESCGLSSRFCALFWRVGLGLLLRFTGVASEAGSTHAAAELLFRTWGTEHGLPQNHSTAIVQTGDGYLWLGTYNGLVRFDGARFVVFNTSTSPGLQSSRITSLFDDRQGTLWLGHDSGELTALRQGRFTPVPLGSHWPGGTIVGIEQDCSGEVWLLHESGLALGVASGRTVPPEPGLTVPCFARDGAGTLWRVHGGKIQAIGARKLDNPTAGSGRGPVEKVPSSSLPKPADTDFLVRTCSSREGGLWLVGGERVRCWHPKGRERLWGDVPWGRHFVTALMESRDGRLWVGTLDNGLYVLQQDGHHLHYSRTNGLVHDWVRSLGEDREGTVWIGTGGGVCAAGQQQVTMVQAPDGWRGRTVLSLHVGKDDTLWLGTEGAGAYRLQRGQWTRYAEAEGLTNLFVWSVLEDTAGRTWAGTWGGGLFELVEGRFVHPPALVGENLAVCALRSGRDGSLWAGTQRGLLRLVEGKVERFAADFARPDVRAIAEDRDGVIWFGLSGGGLGRWEKGQARQLRQADGLPNDYVWSLLADEDGSLWIGTFGGGLARLRDGKFASIGPRQGLPNNVICHIIDDGHGRLWLGTYGGVIRADKRQLNECADETVSRVSFFVYGKGDGLESPEISGGLQPAGCAQADGRLWFPTSKGAAVIDPANHAKNILAPPVEIEEVTVDGRSAAARLPLAAAEESSPVPLPETGTPGKVSVPPGRRRLEIRYTALSFVAPERVRFKYRLEGLEQEWVDAGTERVANYNFLPPGEYDFHVIASNSDGVWNQTGATLALTVLPYVWQTWWFRALGALGAAGVVGAASRSITRRRYHRKLELVERQRAVEKERARIAKDIHDDLGASLTRITLLSQTARADLDEPDKAAADLERIYDTARALTRVMDEIVWAVNPHHDTLDSLMTYLGGFAQDFLSAASIRCRLDVPLRLPARPVTSEVRHNVFLALKEAVHNIVRHADASEAQISVLLAAPGFTLTIRDNGKGFQPGAPSHSGSGEGIRLASGNGLTNMRMRLQEVGGLCQIEAAPEKGTLVRFIVPLAT
jgi:ligand-binding sensor domain-containing protein/signal transduction histidine kinase